MKIFLDTASVSELKEGVALGVVDAAKAGAHVVTLPFAVLEQLMKHPLTDIGLKKFTEDWEKSGAKL